MAFMLNPYARVASAWVWATSVLMTLFAPQSVRAQPASDPDREVPNVRIAPLIGFGLPNLFNFGGLLRVTQYLGAGINVGFIPTVRIAYYGQARISYHELDAYGRVFPFGGGLFLGAGLGYEAAVGTFTGSLDTTAYQNLLQGEPALPNPLVYNSRAEASAWMVNPQAGYLFTSDSGFTIGFDFGVQIPISAEKTTFHSQVSLPSGLPAPIAAQAHDQLLAPADETVSSTLHTVARTPLPTLNIRLGWFL